MKLEVIISQAPQRSMMRNANTLFPSKIRAPQVSLRRLEEEIIGFFLQDARKVRRCVSVYQRRKHTKQREDGQVCIFF